MSNRPTEIFRTFYGGETDIEVAGDNPDQFHLVYPDGMRVQSKKPGMVMALKDTKDYFRAIDRAPSDAAKPASPGRREFLEEARPNLKTPGQRQLERIRK